MQTLAAGSTVDNKYRILSVLGSGGMGVVYKAVQISFDRTVALKVLHEFSLSDQDSIKRFELEAKSLSKLSNLHITQFLDYGIWQETIPYIAMEFIEGETLRARINQSGQLSWKQALEIILQLSIALIDCHKQGLIHRDIKPENIFICKSDSSVKLADFGLVKLIDQSKSAKLTATGLIIGSPQYMSPEQGMGQNADPRSDIYALGTVLYELLSGKLPYEADNPIGLIYKKNNEDPPALSMHVSRQGLPLELETLLKSMLARNPDQRPQSAMQLKEELEKILLKSATLTDRIALSSAAPSAKKTLLTPARLALAVLLICMFAAATGKFILDRKSAKSSVYDLSEKKHAQMIQKRTEEERLKKLIASSEKNLKPKYQAIDALISKLLYIYSQRTDRQTAIDFLQEAIKNRKRRGLAKPYELAFLQLKLAQLLLETSDLKRCELTYKEAAKAIESGPESWTAVEAYLGLANVQELQGRLPEAQKDLRRALAFVESKIGRSNVRTAELYQRLSVVQSLQMQDKEAEQSLLTAYGICKEITDNFSPTLLTAHLMTGEQTGGGLSSSKCALARVSLDLGRLYTKMSRDEEAEKYLETAVSMIDAEEMLNSPGQHAALTRELAIELSAKNPDKARLVCRKYLKNVAGNKAAELHATAVKLYLAELHLQAKDYQKALEITNEAIAERRSICGNKSPQVAEALGVEAKIYQYQNMHEKAESIFRESIDLCQKTAPDDPFILVPLELGLSETLIAQSKINEAEKLVRKGLQQSRKRFGERDKRTLALRGSLIKVISENGTSEEKETLLKENLEQARNTLSNREPVLYLALHDLAAHYAGKGKAKRKECRDLLLELESGSRSVYSSDPVALVRTCKDLAGLYIKIGDFRKAESLLKEALSLNEKTMGENSPSNVAILVALADVGMRVHGDASASLALEKRALAICKAQPGAGVAWHTCVLLSMSEIYLKAGDFNEYENLLRQALVLLKNSTHVYHMSSAKIKLADYLRKSNKNSDEAEALYKSVLSLLKSQKAEDRKYMIQAYLGLSALSLQQKENKNAEEYCKKAIELQAHGDHNPDELARDYLILASIFESLGKPEQAIKYSKQALQIRETEFGYQDKSLLSCLQQLQSLLQPSHKNEAEKIKARIAQIEAKSK